MHVNENKQATSADLAALKPTELTKKQKNKSHAAKQHSKKRPFSCPEPDNKQDSGTCPLAASTNANLERELGLGGIA